MALRAYSVGSILSTAFPIRVMVGWLAASLALLVALVGCSISGPGEPFTYRKTAGHREPSRVFTYDYEDPQRRDLQDRPFFKYAYASESSSAGRKEVRNRILYELMGIMDDYYIQFSSEQREDFESKNLIADVLALGTSAAATASGAASLKTILAAISTGVQGVSSSFDKNVLTGQTIQAIQLQNDALRSTVAGQMIDKMKQSVGDYPLEAGLRDIVLYYQAGTLSTALRSLVTDAGNKKQQADSQQLRSANVSVTKAEPTVAPALIYH